MFPPPRAKGPWWKYRYAGPNMRETGATRCSLTRSPTPGHGHGHSELTALFLEGKRRRARGFDTLKSWPARPSFLARRRRRRPSVRPSP